MLEENLATTAVIEADFRDTDAIFESPEVRRLLADGDPVAALFVSVLHCIPDDGDRPWQLIRDVASRLPAGSYMVISQLASDDPALRADVTDFMAEVTGGQWGRVRSTAEVRRYFEGLDLVGHDHVDEVSLWRPDGDLGPRQATQEWVEYGAIARVR